MSANGDRNESQSGPEMVLVPRHSTKEMLDASYYEALAENAAGVWRAMIEAWNQSSGNSASGSG